MTVSETSRMLEQAAADHAAFARWLRQGADQGTDRELNRHASQRAAPLVLAGGQGASRRIARWLERYVASHATTPVFLHHVGCTGESRDCEHLLYRLLGFIRQHCELRETIPVDPAARRELLPNWLARLAARGRAILVLDRLDALHGAAVEDSLDWLPSWVPDNLRVVASCLDPAVIELLRHRGWTITGPEPGEAPADLSAACDPVALRALAVARRALPRPLLEMLRDGIAEPELDPVTQCCFESGQELSLAGPEFRDMVRKQYLAAGSDLQRAQQQLAGLYLESGGDEALVDGLWLLQQAGDWPALAQQLSGHEVLRRLLQPEWRDFLLEIWWRWGGGDELLKFYRQVIASWSQSAADRAALVCELLDALWQLAEAEQLLPLLDQARQLPGVNEDAARASLDALEGACRLQSGDLDVARAALAAAFESAGQRGGADSPEARRCRHRLAMVLEQQGEMEQAITHYQAALAGREATLGKQHQELIPHLVNLAAVLRADNRLDQARPLYQRALQLSERDYGGGHPQTAACLDSLAGLLYAGQDLEQAEALYQRALGIAETAFGPDHPATAASAHNLGAVLDAREQFQAAEMLFRRALDIRQRALGDEHVDTASSLHNLAGVLDAMGRFDDAEPLYRQAIDVWEQVVGPDHTATATSINNLADLLREQGRYAEAEGLYRRNLDTWAGLLGERHPHTVMTRSELAILLAESKPGSETESLLQAASRETAEVMGWDSMQHINTVVRYAAVLRDSRRRDEARELLARTLKQAEGRISLLSPRLQKLRRHLDALDQDPDTLH
ncbi:tetratricopeptide repeat protein [Methylonatrum kenyense]|uniref:tetratricopeptide repeat protein n=1 Tax=Methylonatrum kenyense TaxID=455253 RepID=UPI0020BE9039|nr:tetratricopeptide repeat protein [Methylonatrum kenyense]MCK8514819.1 tetratricopeptide repeat protein [Methylonatrum kenyense]